MALKDWRLTIRKRDEIEFKRKDTKEEIAIILGVNDIWHLHIPYKKVKHYNSKEQALKFAKSYMKKH